MSHSSNSAGAAGAFVVFSLPSSHSCNSIQVRSFPSRIPNSKAPWDRGKHQDQSTRRGTCKAVSPNHESYKLYYVNYKIGLDLSAVYKEKSGREQVCILTPLPALTHYFPSPGTGFTCSSSYLMYCSRRCASAPTNLRPLTKTVGVLPTSSFFPAS
jgi:hypothetical protein